MISGCEEGKAGAASNSVDFYELPFLMDEAFSQVVAFTATQLHTTYLTLNKWTDSRGSRFVLTRPNCRDQAVRQVTGNGVSAHEGIIDAKGWRSVRSTAKCLPSVRSVI